MDGDGDPDIIVPGDGLWWFENTGGFNFTLHSISAATGYTYRSCTAGDIDNDGDMDIIAAGNFTTTDLYRNNNGTFQLETIDNNWAWWRLTLGDLNGDSYLDLLAVEDIYLNDNGDLLWVVTHSSGMGMIKMGRECQVESTSYLWKRKNTKQQGKWCC